MSGARALLVASVLLLSSCSGESDVTLWVGTAKSAGSGVVQTVRNLFDMGRSAKDQMEKTAEEFRHRAAQVQSGVNLLLQGKEMIEGAVK